MYNYEPDTSALLQHEVDKATSAMEELKFKMECIEKGIPACPFCVKKTKIYGLGNYGTRMIRDSKKGCIISADNSSGEKVETSIQIKYCPMCGRKLKEEE